MVTLDSYWTIIRLDPAGGRLGYKPLPISQAKNFFEKFSGKSEAISQGEYPSEFNSFLLPLLPQFKTGKFDEKVNAGFCLRCYTSQFIPDACKKLVQGFSGNRTELFQEVLPCVLNDDGTQPIILDQDGKTQLILNQEGEARPTQFKFFTVEVLQSFDPQHPSRKSLKNWVYDLVKCNDNIKKVLSNLGFKTLSDWAILNRAKPKQIEQLSTIERPLVEVFHAVYRQDRRQNPSKRNGKCPDPSQEQLVRMSALLSQRGIQVKSPQVLLQELRKAAKSLRNYDVWSCRKSLEEMVPPDFDYDESKNDWLKSDDLGEVEEVVQKTLEKSFKVFLEEQLLNVLDEAIASTVEQHIADTRNRPSYSVFADRIILGLKLIYCEGRSQTEIAPILGMNNNAQVGRVLDRQHLLNRVRFITHEKLYQLILEWLKDAHIESIADQCPVDAQNQNFQEKIMAAIESFTTVEVFPITVAAKDNFYGKRLCYYLNQH